jgi:hypothetical protein
MKRSPVLFLALLAPLALADSETWPLDDSLEVSYDPALVHPDLLPPGHRGRR